MFKKILIANRGEIACRIIRTARNLGIETVAIYGEDEKNALHGRLADEAFLLKGGSLGDTYLNGSQIVEIALKSGAEAIHPGYGFLSENRDFAELCAQKGIVFVGPTPEAMALMSSKSAAKKAALEAGLPVVPGYEGEDQSFGALASQAEKVGFPLMIKAIMGGGGKGMRQVLAAHDFEGALLSCQREAQNAFGDARVLLEKYIPYPRHIEVQIFGDHGGQVVHLFERDCSLQRRHQKIIEEAPAHGLSEDLRTRLCEAAVDLARHVGYTNAGTVEFLLDRSGQFYFMEMNTRLQVEHPVTEAITGLDLVEWQLKVASGEPLPLAQSDIPILGAALECRIYAEDPQNQFLPSTGPIDFVHWDGGLRVESGLQAGDRITPSYDPMIAKLISHGASRKEALSQMIYGLRHSAVLGGIVTNQTFLGALLRDPMVQVGEVDVGWLDRGGFDYAQLSFLLSSPDGETVKERLLCLAAFLLTESLPQDSTPWGLCDGWSLGGLEPLRLKLLWENQECVLSCLKTRAGYRISFDDFSAEMEGHFHQGRFQGSLNGECFRAFGVVDGDKVLLSLQGVSHKIERKNPLQESCSPEEDLNHLRAPMTGKVIHLAVSPGDEVEKGDVLLILEAMKMEHAIKAPHRGVVIKSPFGEGDVVDQGIELVELAEVVGHA